MKKALNILHTEWSTGWGGQEIRIMAEMCAFRERGFTMNLACRRVSTIFEKALAEGFKPVPIEFGSPLNLVVVSRLARTARNLGAQVIHTHSSKDSWIGGFAGRLARIPVVRSRHLSSQIKKKPTNRLLYHHLPAAVIPSGRFIADQLVRDTGMRPENIFSIPAGADEERFHPDPRAGADFRQEHGIPTHAGVIGIAGVLRSWKGHHVLLRALAPLLKENADLWLLVVGEGPRRQFLENLVAELDLNARVVFTGHRADIQHAFPAFDLHVLPSLKNEATSQVVPQAMLCNVANVVSDAGGLPEVVRDGETGRIVPAGDEQALREAVAGLMADPSTRKKFATAGRNLALEKFTFRGQIESTDRVYRHVLKENR